MQPFLERTANYLLDSFGNNFTGIAVVLPNRRAALYLRRFLARGLNGPAWAPQFYSIEDFLVSISGLKEIDTLPLLFELYEVHRTVEKEQTQPFGEFLRWGQQLLSDFNEIDRYLVDPHALFTYLDEARAISLWNLENQPLTDFEQNYLRFYHNLFLYYRELTERLLAKGLGYPGLIFRQAASKGEEFSHRMPYRHVVFAGFNALTRAEESIITALHREKKATLLWDADPYYLNDERQEAGMFLREWFRKWPSEEARWIFDNYSSGRLNIRVVGVPDQMGQVKFCGNILRDLARKNKPEDSTAVVLPDPSLLIPLLNSLPPEIKDFNITAGLPLSQTPIAGLFDALFRMHLNAERFSKTGPAATQVYYYKDVLALLMNPMVRRIASTIAKGNRFSFDEVAARIRMGQRVFLSPKDVVNHDHSLFSPGIEFLEVILRPWRSTRDVISGSKGLLELLRQAFMPPGMKLEVEYVYAFTRIIHQLASISAEFSGSIDLSSLYQLFRQILASTSLPFSGEPLKGIQVMGMLETRTLDFDNVILLSCNEDLLPSSKSTPSFIPFDIKRNFGLPTFRHKDAVYAYHFYRLLQRAKEVWILYGTEPDQLGGGDKSRFIKQLQHELKDYNRSVTVSESILVTPVRKSALQNAVIIRKEEDVMNRILARAEKGFSATSLNAFRNCGLKFYLSEIAGIREPDEAEDTIDPAILGSAVHDALQRLYKPFERQQLSASDLEKMMKKSADAVEKGFEKKYKGSDIRYGKNLLLVHVAKMMVSRFLKYEQEMLGEGYVLNVESLESYFEIRIPFISSGKEINVRIKGFIDRLDRFYDCLRIIDYKTGTVESRYLKLVSWDDLDGDPGYNMIFQLLVYAFLLKERIQGGTKVVSGIYPLKKISSGFLHMTLPDDKAKEGYVTALHLRKFEEVLSGLITEILDPSVPFTQTSNTDTCRHCPYAILCAR